MDVYYEESAVYHDSVKGEKRYKILHVCSLIALTIGIMCLICFIFNMPFGSIDETLKEEERQNLIALKGLFGFIGAQGAMLLGVWFVLYWFKQRINVNYDYVFVSGEIRISKVFNVNRRKLLVKIMPEQILQLGDVDNASYDRLLSDPNTKSIICTSNQKPADGKFFMYVLTVENGMKKLYVLECREELLINILKFVKRTTLESDYVMQEKKQQNKIS